jgi:hypothetical protein
VQFTTAEQAEPAAGLDGGQGLVLQTHRPASHVQSTSSYEQGSAGQKQALPLVGAFAGQEHLEKERMSLSPSPQLQCWSSAG